MSGMIKKNVENIRWFQSISRMVFIHENQSRLKELKNFKQNISIRVVSDLE